MIADTVLRHNTLQFMTIDVTKEGSVDASKHLDRLLEEQDKSRKKAEDLWLVFNAVLTSSSAPSRILSHGDTHPLWS